MTGIDTYPEGWTYRDQVLAATADIVNDALAGRVDQRPPIPTSFALSSPTERLLAIGAYSIAWWGSVGDGTYRYNTGFVGGTGLIGIGLIGASLIGSGISRSRAKHRAADDAEVRWRPIDDGHLYISTDGCYLAEGAAGTRAFAFSQVIQADMDAPGCVRFTSSGPDGNNTWSLTSDWAEAVFGLWAVARNRMHPQWLDGSWFPADIMRARALHYGQTMPELMPPA